MTMKKFLLVLILISFASCKKDISQEEALFYKEINAPIDTTVLDSVVGQVSFNAINAKIDNAKKDTVKKAKKDSVKTTEQKIAETKKKLEEAKKKSEKEKKQEELASKEKQQQEKKIGELIENPEN